MTAGIGQWLGVAIAHCSFFERKETPSEVTIARITLCIYLSKTQRNRLATKANSEQHNSGLMKCNVFTIWLYRWTVSLTQIIWMSDTHTHIPLILTSWCETTKYRSACWIYRVSRRFYSTYITILPHSAYHITCTITTITIHRHRVTRLCTQAVCTEYRRRRSTAVHYRLRRTVNRHRTTDKKQGLIIG